MHTYLIDPEAGTVEQIKGKPTLQQIYALLGCDLIDAVRLPNSPDVFYCDDEGLFTGHKSATFIEMETGSHMNQTIVGKMLYIGVDHEGESASPEGTFIYTSILKKDPQTGIANIIADPTKKITCRINRIYHQCMSPWESELTISTQGYIPIEKTLEQKLDEIKTQALKQG